MTTKTINLYPDGTTDGSHPASGALVLMDEGEAFFGGAVYRREGYPLPKEEPLAQWERELLAGPEKIKEPRFKVGDKIIVKKDQWNIDYNLVDGPVVGEITRVHEGLDGFSYSVQHKTVRGRTLEIWTAEAAEPYLKPAPTSRFKAGDRVVLRNDDNPGHRHLFHDRTGTVLADTFTSDGYGYDIHVDVNNSGPAWFYDSEVDFLPTPPPVTHHHPEGLYALQSDADFLVYVQHEDETDRYTITYLTGPRDERGIPDVNKRMSDGVFAAYTLVTAA